MRNWILIGWWLLTAALAIAALVGPRIGAAPVAPGPTSGPEPPAILWGLAFGIWAVLTVVLVATRRNKPAADEPPD
jgi:hypothetical protein